jgi:hypothetical protein
MIRRSQCVHRSLPPVCVAGLLPGFISTAISFFGAV